LYQEYWNLKKDAFLNTFDRSSIFFTPQLSRVFNVMLLSLIEGTSLLVLSGDKGSGKTHLIKALEDELKSEMSFVVIPCFEGFDSTSFFNELGFGFNNGNEGGTLKSINQYYSIVKKEYKINQKPFVFVFDNAHLINDDAVFQEINNLFLLSHKKTQVANIILSGRNPLINKLKKAAKLLAQASVNLNLEKLTKEQIKEYIQHRLIINGQEQKIFESNAAELISDFSNGDLKLVNLLCRLGMIAAAQKGIKSINDLLLKAIIDEYNQIAEKIECINNSAREEIVLTESQASFKKLAEPEEIIPSVEEEKTELEEKEISIIIERVPSNEETAKAQDLYKAVHAYLSDILDNLEHTEKADLSKIFSYAEEIVDSVEKSNALLLEALKPSKGHDLARHLINVAIISLKIGKGLGYKNKDLIRLVQVGLLHDVGMIKIPRSIIEKPTYLTDDEFNEIKKHPIYSYQLIKNQGKQYEWIAEIAYQEQERENGKGYPRGLKGNEIHEYARIIGVADIFEAYSNNRAWRKNLIYYDALQEVIRLRDESLPAYIIKSLINEFSIFPLNSYVKLNNGEIGKVINIDKKNLMRPIVQILYDTKGNSLNEFKNIALSKIPCLFITKALNEEELPGSRE
jgi:HD-GYP domain-containing protein (c-di-GMP phosphodiesterase class II)/type II secretory pathway predicted ATPase ExeA